jgi:hypothetical protein
MLGYWAFAAALPQVGFVFGVWHDFLPVFTSSVRNLSVFLKGTAPSSRCFQQREALLEFSPGRGPPGTGIGNRLNPRRLYERLPLLATYLIN